MLLLSKRAPRIFSVFERYELGIELTLIPIPIEIRFTNLFLKFVLYSKDILVLSKDRFIELSF